MGENEKMQANLILKFIPISPWNYRSVMGAGVTLQFTDMPVEELFAKVFSSKTLLKSLDIVRGK